ncbi:MAG: DUF6624 domain-containing protein [Saprospiraceae bacterium]
MKTKMRLCCGSLLLPFIAFAQNLVRNPGFENHSTAPYNTEAEFSMIMPGWRSMKVVNIHDCTKTDRYQQFNYGVDLSKYKAKEGCSMMEMGFSPNCGKLGDGNFPYLGCANYLVSPLSQTLEIGQLYEISFWINFTNAFVRQDPDAHKHVGMLLSNKPLRPDTLLEILENNTFLAPPLPYNAWKQVTWYVRPTCELNYLTIGTFKDAHWPRYTQPGFDRSVYFIDQVSVTKITATAIAETVVPAYYCKNIPKEDSATFVDMPDVTCYFASDDWQLDKAAVLALTAFAAEAQANPDLVFLISGHTDGQGSNHAQLSQKRADAVREYLTAQHAIPLFRLIPLYGGNAYPVASNDTESGRKQNRRVVIQRIEMPKSAALYRKAIEYLAESKTDSAFMMLRGWVMHEKDGGKILALFDPRLEGIRKDPRWKTIYTRIKAAYIRYPKSELAFALDSLYCEDQKYRTLAPYIQDLGGYLKILDTVDFQFPEISDTAWLEKDHALCQQLLRLLEKHGFPAESDVGARAAKAAAVILIHSPDTALLKKYLPILESRCREGEGDWNYYATLYDRLKTHQGLPQRYGTQFVASKEIPGALVMHPLENRAMLNVWRGEIGLPRLLDEEIDRVARE